MKVFLIGGTGYIGRAVASELLERGHTPVVLARSTESAAKLTDPRIRVVPGQVGDIDLVTEQARVADAVVYLAVAGLRGASSDDVETIDAVLSSYRGTGKAFIHTSGLAVYLGVEAPIVTSQTDVSAGAPEQAWRVDLEQRVLTATNADVRAIVIRPSIVYGNGTASTLILALLQHVAAGNPSLFINDGANRISTVHIKDLAALYVAALEKAPAGTSYNAATGSILGYDLAYAAAAAMNSSSEPIGVSIQGALAALGGAGPALSQDIKVSEWRALADLGWSATQPGLALELSTQRIAAER